MIDQLHVQNVALIKEASLELSEGLTVITGETGSGKTALLHALKMLIGERADTSMIRADADEMLVEGSLYTAANPDGHIVRRRITATGRSRIDIDGQLASVRELAEDFGTSVDLCGQHEHQKLLSTHTHLELLDSWAHDTIKPCLEQYRQCFVQVKACTQAAQQIKATLDQSQSRLDEAQFVLSQIGAVDPQQDEYEQLQAKLMLTQHAESLFTHVDGAYSCLSDDDEALDMLACAITELQQAARHDQRLEAFADRLQSSLVDIEDVSHELREYRTSMEFDPDALEAMHQRMSQLQGLIRSYGPSIQQVFERRQWAADIVAAATDGDNGLAQATRALQEAQQALQAAAEALNDARRAAAPKLTKAITRQMQRLQMGSASLEFDYTELSRQQWTQTSPAKFEFLYKPASGVKPQSLAHIASGGEISRVMLACKVVFGRADTVDTLIFDEIDAGVGGSTAVSLGAVLQDLARTHQVLVVTHLPQIAVLASKHYVVDKTDAAVPETHITEVTGAQRMAEIARLLSGDTSKASLEHAQALLDAASQHA
ncbi:DNA repair protein RecN [Atopobium deltae]|uniref:DNA repair protein RecN n=1 Tax=Atopobium deltae TaxID=1393034 RepID=A0A133XUQ1_9ACTN|nr:DNA repair protein RecN [Atopobium deltae]KXB34668.1 DNA repair protein RecN [Atopobium deltae]